ncbi:uncharacterized protein RAG0_12584 [Rhynchosporium agropyri]|uniref:GRF-like zinc ribbon domain-containing protein n=1 Tax=Rhynchosporium agropyri TaxID=914238 RepID=A0A1E1L8W9_9HELO|nr:uncharacterized protein RAG0_12584 [Rhynchosporium agropyri]
MVTINGILLDVAPSTDPNCRSCQRETVHRVTRVSNRKGNANRPYYICIPCDKFQCFDDDRGNDPRNPPCLCHVPSRQQVAGLDTSIPGGLHYVCGSGACEFYKVRRNASEIPVTLDADLIVIMAGLRLV